MIIVNALHRREVCLVALVAASLCQGVADGATFYWSGTNSTNWTNTSGAWSSSASSQVTPAGTPGSSDDVVFNRDAYNASDKTISLNSASQNANSLTFKSSGTTQIIRASSTNSAGNNLTLGGGGMTLNAGVGAVTFGLTDNKVNVRLLSSSTFNNNSSSLIRFYQTLETSTSAAAGLTTLTIAGSGTGGLQFDDAINNNSTTGTLSVVVNTAAGATTLFDAAGNYSGGTTLTQGILGVGSATALGTGPLAINGGALAAKGSARTLANPVTVGGDFVLGGIGSGYTPASITLSGSVNLGGATRTITLKNSATISGSMSNGGLSLTGSFGGNSRTLTLSGNNTFSGGSTVTSGTLIAGSAAAFGSGGVTITGGAVSLNSRADVANTFTMNGGLLDSGTINASQLAGGSGTVNAVVTGTAAFSKTGSGVLTLSNANTYSGQTLVTAGTLLVSGTLTQSQATVSSAATLGGTGSVAGGLALQSGGFVQPGITGTAVGALATGPVTLAGTYVATITGTATSLLDRLVVTGSIDFTGGTIQPVLAGYVPAQNDRFRVVTWTGARTGTPTFDFSQATLSSGLSWDTSSFGTDGTLIVVPEPGSLALLAAAAVGVAVVRRRRVR